MLTIATGVAIVTEDGRFFTVTLGNGQWIIIASKGTR